MSNIPSNLFGSTNSSISNSFSTSTTSIFGSGNMFPNSSASQTSLGLGSSSQNSLFRSGSSSSGNTFNFSNIAPPVTNSASGLANLAATSSINPAQENKLPQPFKTFTDLGTNSNLSLQSDTTPSLGLFQSQPPSTSFQQGIFGANPLQNKPLLNPGTTSATGTSNSITPQTNPTQLSATNSLSTNQTNLLGTATSTASNSLYGTFVNTLTKSSIGNSNLAQMNDTILKSTLPASDLTKSLNSTANSAQPNNTNSAFSSLTESKGSSNALLSTGLQIDPASKPQSSSISNPSIFPSTLQGLNSLSTSLTTSNSTTNNQLLITKPNLTNSTCLNLAPSSTSSSKVITSKADTSISGVSGSPQAITTSVINIGTNTPIDTSASLEKTHKALIESIHHERVDNLLINWENRAKQRVQTFSQYADLVSEIDLNTILQIQKLNDLIKNQEITFSRQKNLAQVIYNIEQQQKNLIPILNSVENELKSKTSSAQDQNLDSNILLNSQQLQWLEQEISQINDIFINLSETRQPEIVFSINKAIAMHESSIESLIQQVETLESSLDKIENKIFK